MKFSIVRILLASGVLGASAFAQAELVRVQVSATVNHVEDAANLLGGRVQVGDRITGTYTFDTATPDADSYHEFGHYRHPAGIGGFDLDVGGMTVKSDPQDTDGLFAVDVYNSQNEEGYHVVSFDNLVPIGNGIEVRHASIDLYSWDQSNAFNSDALPVVPPNPAQFNDRRLMIWGDNGYDYFDIEATVESLIVDGDGPAEVKPGAYSVKAEVLDVYDPYNILQSRINIGDEINGGYQLEPSLTDGDSSPEWAHYEHPLSEGYGFDLAVNELTFASNSAQRPVRVSVGNATYQDSYEIWSEGGTTNGGFEMDHIMMYLADHSGTALSSTALLQTPTPALFDGYTDLNIAGKNSQGEYFHIHAKLIAVDPAASDDPELVLLPSSGKILPGQAFDLGIALAPGERPVKVAGSINGADHSPWFDGCYINGGETNSYFYICPQINHLLHPSAAGYAVDVRVTLEDGSTRHAQVRWDMLHR